MQPLDPENPADIAFAALCEVGRRDLGLLVQVFYDDDGSPYVEANDEILGESDWALVDKAEAIMRQFYGYAPMARDKVDA